MFILIGYISFSCILSKYLFNLEQRFYRFVDNEYFKLEAKKCGHILLHNLQSLKDYFVRCFQWFITL
jgi:hypothetical protein